MAKKFLLVDSDALPDVFLKGRACKRIACSRQCKKFIRCRKGSGYIKKCYVQIQRQGI